MIRVDEDTATIFVHKNVIARDTAWNEFYNYVYNKLLQDAEALRIVLNRLTNVTWVVCIIDNE